MTQEEKTTALGKVFAAVEPLGYLVEVDEETSAVIVNCSTKHRSRQSGAVLQAALAAGVNIVGTRAGRRGFEIVVG